MYVVAFNGPPKCGKDTLSHMLAKYMEPYLKEPAREESLSYPLRKIAYAMTGYVGKTIGLDYDVFKETDFEMFVRSGRELMIDISESFLKKVYGQSIMVRMMTERNDDMPGLILIRDCGFQIEVDELCEIYGKLNVLVVNIMRDGCDFSNDSREWVNHPSSSYNQCQVPNNGTLDDLKYEATRLFGRMVNHLDWTL